MRKGDWFQVDHKGHFAHGQSFQANRVRREYAKGNPDVAVLDLGVMVELIIEDYYGRPCRHAVPVEWCRRIPRPSMAKRVRR